MFDNSFFKRENDKVSFFFTYFVSEKALFLSDFFYDNTSLEYQAIHSKVQNIDTYL